MPREFDFYGLYPAMSRHLMEHYAGEYDWISWPDQDEFLEGPTRERSYYEHLVAADEAGVDWIAFENFVFWWTGEDDPSVPEATRRIRRYALWADCPPRIRAWRASVTNIREFNHNPLEGTPSPRPFRLRHYPMRSAEQMRTRVERDRAGLRRGDMNFHYENMARRMDELRDPAAGAARRRRRRARSRAGLRLAPDLRARARGRLEQRGAIKREFGRLKHEWALRAASRPWAGSGQAARRPHDPHRARMRWLGARRSLAA